MRRLLRILLNAVMVLSLLLCLASAALWVRGYWRQDDLRWVEDARPGEDSSAVEVSSAMGGVSIYVGAYSAKFLEEHALEGWSWVTLDIPPTKYAGGRGANQWGFALESYRDQATRFRTVTLPGWLAASVFALLPTTRLALAIRRRRRVREGHCAKCGYDLRATPDRCPECGAAAAAK